MTRRRAQRAGRLTVALAVAAATAGPPAAARAEAAGRWLSIGALTGTVRPDPAFADYHWDVSPAPAWGAQARLGWRALSAGVRTWRAGTTQSLGVDGTVDPRVTTAAWEATAAGRIAHLGRSELLAVGGVGRLHAGYNPDRVEVPAAGGAVAVEFEAIEEWTATAGVGLRRPLGGPWAATLEVDHRWYGMDTAHRAGGEIVTGRRGFGDWSARVELAWVRGW